MLPLTRNGLLVFLLFLPIALFAQSQSRLSDTIPSDRLTAWQDFNNRYNNHWKIRWDPNSKIPRRIYGFKTEPYPGSAETIARQFLTQYQKLFRVDPSQLKMTRSQRYLGNESITFQQYFRGLLVDWAIVTVHVTKQGEVILVTSDYIPDIQVDTTPQQEARAAVDTVVADLGLEVTPKEKEAAGHELVVYQGREDGTIYLCWKVTLFTQRPLGSWIYYLDAMTGRVVHHYNNLRF